MTFQPRVSIMTPCYNHAKYLDEYFRSLLSQTYRNLEVIIIDDASTDESWQKILSYEPALKRAFPSVILERHSHAGMLRTMAAAFRKVQGDLFCILESDDYYEPSKIEENVRYFAEHPEDGCVHSEFYEVSQDGSVRALYYSDYGYKKLSGWIYEDLLLRPSIQLVTFCARTDLGKKYVSFDRYADRGYVRGDSPMWFDLSLHARFGYIERPLASYRVLEESVSHSKDPLKTKAWKLGSLRIKMDALSAYGASEPVRKTVCCNYYRNIFELFWRDLETEPCTEAYLKLAEEDPSWAADARNRLRFFIVKHRGLHFIAKIWRFIFRPLFQGALGVSKTGTRKP